MTTHVWVSHGEFLEGNIVKKADLHWGKIEVSENETVYSLLIQWHCREPDSSLVYVTGRHLGNGDMLELSPKRINWGTRIDTLGVEPCLLIVSYFTAFQQVFFGKVKSVDHKYE